MSSSMIEAEELAGTAFDRFGNEPWAEPKTMERRRSRSREHKKKDKRRSRSPADRADHEEGRQKRREKRRDRSRSREHRKRDRRRSLSPVDGDEDGARRHKRRDRRDRDHDGFNDDARGRPQELDDSPTVGKVYEGHVTGLKDFGAFVNFLGPKDGLVHISELAQERVKQTGDVVKEGDTVHVKVIGLDDRGKVKLSMKRVDQKTGEDLEIKAEAS